MLPDPQGLHKPVHLLRRRFLEISGGSSLPWGSCPCHPKRQTLLFWALTPFRTQVSTAIMHFLEENSLQPVSSTRGGAWLDTVPY